ncbi:hypothetical protein Tco_0008189 [Tanacetum coccineum]
MVFNNTLTSEAALSCEPMVNSLNNNEIDIRISFDESNDEDCTVIFDKNLFSYKIIYVNNLKTDSENDNDKVNMPLLPSPEPSVSCLNDLDFFKDFKNEFPAIIYNDAQTSKSDLLTEPILNLQHIDEFNLKDETSLSECDEEEQNVLNFNDLFCFNVIYHDELKTDTDNDNDKVDIKHSSGDLSVKHLPDVINTDDGAYAHGSNELLETNLYDISKTLKNSRPLPDFEEYAIDTPYMILWSKIKENTFSANTPYPKTPILCIGQYSVSKKLDMAYWSIRRIQKSDMAYPISCARILEYFILEAHAKSSNTPY